MTVTLHFLMYHHSPSLWSLSTRSELMSLLDAGDMHIAGDSFTPPVDLTAAFALLPHPILSNRVIMAPLSTDYHYSF